MPMPAAPPMKNRSTACVGEKTPVTAAAIAKRETTIAGGSVTKPSPSKKVWTSRGIRSERITDSTATGSGGEMMAPSAKAAGQVKAECSEWATTATAAVETRTNTTDKRTIG